MQVVQKLYKPISGENLKKKKTVKKSILKKI